MPDEKPPVVQKSLLATGNIPQGPKQMIIAAIIMAAFVVMIFQGNTTPKQSTAVVPAVPGLQTQPMSPEEIRRRAERAAHEMALAKDSAQRATANYQAMNAEAERQPVQPVVGPDGRAYYPQYQEQSPPVDPWEKRMLDARFSPNLMSFGKPAQVSPVADVPPSPTPVVEAAKPAAKPVESKVPTYKLYEGDVIEAVLTNRLEGSFAGPVNCMVTVNVYSRDGQHRLIPQGTRVLGEAKQVQDQNQERLAVIFHRMIMPDGFSVDLDKVPVLDRVGSTALHDQVNHHYLSTFGTSIALGLLGGLSLYNTGGVYSGDGVDMYRQGVANQLGRDAQQILNRKLNRMPTITVREGLRVKILLNADLSLPDVLDHQEVK